MIQPYTLLFYPLFLSPHLTHLSLMCSFFGAKVPDEVLSGLTSVILALEPFHLRSLSLQLCIPVEVDRRLESAVSSGLSMWTLSHHSIPINPLVRRGSSTHHAPSQTYRLVRNEWIAQRIRLFSIQCLPQLEYLELLTEVSLGWTPLLEAIARYTSGQPPGRGPGQKLAALNSFMEVPIDAAFVSPIMVFHGLICFTLRPSCSGTGGCTLNPTDDEIAETAAALPRLQCAMFGPVCSAN